MLEVPNLKFFTNKNYLNCSLVQDSMKALKHLVVEEQKKAQESKGVKIVRGKRYIVPDIVNFRRTKKGKALMQQELRLLLEFQAKNFPTKPMLTVDRLSVRFSEQNTVCTVTMESLMDKVFDFFSYYFHDVRSKQAFGVKVQGWLVDAAVSCIRFFFQGVFWFGPPVSMCCDNFDMR